MARTDPIFIHSLFRCATTYFFHKFRALGADFTCYQEPFNESLAALNRRSRHERLLATAEGSGLRHPPLDRPYFYEFWLRRQQLQGLYRRAFAYREYFPGPTLPQAQRRWIGALLEHASGRAVLQCCRSSGRAAAMRSAFAGVHLHLWREPRTQWWSYKVAEYFDSVSRRIYDADRLPAPLEQLAPLACEPNLTPQQNYALFYGLWLDAWLRLVRLADLSISVDAIAVSTADNQACSQRLAALLGQPVDIADIRTPGMAFAPQESLFYEEIEQQVGELFVRSGRADAARVATAEGAARGARRARAPESHDATAERNLRQVALDLMQRLSGTQEARQSSPRPRPRRTATPLLRALQWLRLGQPRMSEPGALPSDSALLPAVISETARDGYHRG